MYRTKEESRAKIEKYTSGSKDSGYNLAGHRQLIYRLKKWPQWPSEDTLPPGSFPPMRYSKNKHASH